MTTALHRINAHGDVLMACKPRITKVRDGWRAWGEGVTGWGREPVAAYHSWLSRVVMRQGAEHRKKVQRRLPFAWWSSCI
jgi:hypothetical protein